MVHSMLQWANNIAGSLLIFPMLYFHCRCMCLIYVYICIYIYIHVYIYICIYIYMQLIVQQWQPQQSSHPVDVQPSHLPHLMHQEQVGHKVSMMLGSNPPFIWTLVNLEWMHSMGIKAVAGKQSHTTPFSGWFNFSLIPSMSSYNWDHATTNWCFRTEKWIVSTFTISPWPQSCCFLNKFSKAFTAWPAPLGLPNNDTNFLPWCAYSSCRSSFKQ